MRTIAILFALLFPRTARGFLLILCALILIVVLYFGSSFSDWRAACDAHYWDAGYREYHHCD